MYLPVFLTLLHDQTPTTRDGRGRALVDLTEMDEEEEEEEDATDEGKGKDKKQRGRRRRLTGMKALLSARYGLKPLNGGWVWCEVGAIVWVCVVC